MKREKPIKVIKVSDEELKTIKEELLKTRLSDSHKKIIIAILDAYYWLASLYQAKKLSMNKIRRLFGFKTEKLPKDEDKDDDSKKNDSEKGDSSEGRGPKNSGKKPDSRKNTGKGHGRKGKDDMPGAERVFHKLEDHKKGDLCPSCLVGKLYPVKPGTFIHFTGRSPLQATVHETEKLRCNACGKYFEAELDEELKKKYHPSADVAIAVQKYALGVPFYRCGKWQNDLGVPLAPSTQWERSEHLSNSVFPVYKYLLTCAAEGELFHADDTKNRILDLQKEIKKNKEQRVGVYTTAIISKVKDKVINLFFTGRSYAAENLDRLLAHRINENNAILMSDALRLNLPRKASVLWAKCFGHARRNFFDYRDKYGQMVTYIIRQIGKIYHNDKKTIKMSDDQRLKYHQKHSAPILIKLRRWALKKIYLKKIEPNEELGEAFGYFFNHYKELTLFLRVPGAPIDNSVAERLIKTVILHRKNSYFFKTMMGAFVGDILMSLIATCRSAGVSAHKFLLALHEHAELVKANPENFLPWNFEENLPA